MVGGAPIQADCEQAKRRALMAAIPLGVLFLDAGGRIQEMNRAAVELLGEEATELTGAPFDVLLPNDPAAIDINEIIHTLLGDADQSLTVPLTTPSGELREVQLRGSVVSSWDKGLTGIVALLLPVSETDNRLDRLERQRDQLTLFNKVLRHDIRNDANLILEITRRLQRLEDPDPPERTRLLGQIEDGTGRIVEMTERAREFVAAFESLDDGPQPRELAPILREEIAKAGTVDPDVTVTPPEEIPSVTVLANEMLPAVFRNLLVNAIAHNDADDPAIDVSVMTDESEVEIRIADNGPGISDGIREAVSAGPVAVSEQASAGFGLSIVLTLLNLFDGALEIDDNEPRGTVITVSLVRVPDPNGNE